MEQIYLGLPEVKQHSRHRVPTTEEISRFTGFEDMRTKVIVLTRVSAGI
ncbi:MAG: hypothetical protein M3162_06810 [Thermoproteota archaeon]|nr:hypothetical protein [Thermoproteota archaeon]